MSDPSARRQRLHAVMTQEGLDALLISHPTNVTYLTGFTGDSSHLVLTRDRAVLVSDPRYTGQIQTECPGLDAHIRPPTQPLHHAVSDVLRKLSPHGVGFESSHLTVADFETFREQLPSIDWKPGRDRVEQLRAIKDEGEIALIRNAIAIAQRAFTAFRSLIRSIDCEKDLADALEGHVRHCGGRATSFPSIVAVGERAALPHAPPTDCTINGSELVLVDWGAEGPEGYKSDLTRVLAVRKISPKLEAVHTVVVNAQRRAMETVRPGVKGHDVDAAARAVIAEAGHGEHFGHGLGHGVGLQIHEAPAVRPNSQTVLQPGMVITIEPGIYLPGWGGVRIEDDVLVTPDGCEVLTSVPRDLPSMTLFG